MKEAIFLQRNKEKWAVFEREISNEKTLLSPDELADLYIKVSDDLSFARTFYPESKSIAYLNKLSNMAHRKIYSNRKIEQNKPFTFFLYELPIILHKNRRYLLISLIIFLVSSAIGWVSALYDENFVRLILGDSYVNMTMENIQKGDPMAVYKGGSESDMFLAITFNNIRVSFLAYVFGLFFSFGTFYIMFSNGVMLGAFQSMFYQYNLLGISASAIYLHGTLELSAIVIAGAAGIRLGNGLLFPDTYTRYESLKMAVRESFKIIIGLMPVFIMAGFIESFITRYYKDMPSYLNWLIVIVSGAFILFYFVIYPVFVARKFKVKRNKNEDSRETFLFESKK